MAALQNPELQTIGESAPKDIQSYPGIYQVLELDDECKVVDSNMKTLTCDLCKYEARGETFEEWMNALKPHYMQAHPEVMNDSNKTKADMDEWMAENKARFEAV